MNYLGIKTWGILASMISALLDAYMEFLAISYLLGAGRMAASHAAWDGDS